MNNKKLKSKIPKDKKKKIIINNKIALKFKLGELELNKLKQLGWTGLRP